PRRRSSHPLRQRDRSEDHRGDGYRAVSPLARGERTRLHSNRTQEARGPRAGNLPLARVRARLIGGKLTAKNGGNAGFLPCYFPFWPGKAALWHQESFPIPVESTHLGRGSRI